MNLEVEDQADNIEDRTTFIRFVHALVHNLREHPEEWENVELVDYLSGLAAWVESMEQLYRNLEEPIPEVADWKFLGQILLGAKYQE